MNTLPALGFGLGLRPTYYPDILDGDVDAVARRIDWFEVISENVMVDGGPPLAALRRVRERWPVVLHGVSLSLGSTDPLNDDYLKKLAALADEVQPAFVSDHLCWSSVGGLYVHDLLPLPYSEEALDHVVARVLRVQDALKRPILVENVSSYLTFRASVMSEWEFLTALSERADCGLLLDVNNVFVSAHNHGFDAHAFIDGLPVERVAQMHLAGHTRGEPLYLDTHDHPVCDEGVALYRRAVARFGAGSTLLERDDQFPSFEELLSELDRARQVAASASADQVERVA